MRATECVLAVTATAALAFGAALGAPRGEQLELLEAAQEFGGEEARHGKGETSNVQHPTSNIEWARADAGSPEANNMNNRG